MGANRTFIAKRSKAVTTHGQKRRGAVTVEYKTWLAMKRRCYDTKHKDYANWGGRGIAVCERWLKNFAAFFVDMGPRPADKDSIDRIDPNKDYSLENCRWATFSEQGSENRRNLVAIEIDGLHFHSLSEACRHFGVPLTRVHGRLQAGIPLAEAFVQTRLKSRRTRESYLPKSAR